MVANARMHVFAISEPTKYQRFSFLTTLISNKKSGFDLDKVDYMVRDCHHLGFFVEYSGALDSIKKLAFRVFFHEQG